MKCKVVSLGEVIRHRKGSITIDDVTSYKLCRVQLHRRGVVLRQRLLGAEINTKKPQVCKAGDFLVAEMDAKVGGYGFVPPELDGAIVSSHYYLFELDDSKLHPPFLEVISQAQIIQKQIVPKGSTNYSSIRPDSVLAWQIPLPDMDIQKRVARNFEAIQTKLTLVENEITHQQSLLAKLKQAILQEAIQGKLTADWREPNPDEDPASQLLQRIQAEKARLIATKKLRPEKPLPKITPAEIPFEIPKGWEWCRLGRLFLSLQYGTANKCSYEPSKNTAILRIPNVSTGKLTTDDLKFTNLTSDEKEQYSLRRHDVLMIRSNGSRSLVGSAVHFDEEGGNYGYAGYLMRLRFPTEIYSPYVVAVLASRTLRDQIEVPLRTTVGINNVNSTEVSNLKIPLPPLAEQAAIVERVESLMTTCRALEAEIERSRTHAANLLQAVLKEAFAPASMD